MRVARHSFVALILVSLFVAGCSGPTGPDGIDKGNRPASPPNMSIQDSLAKITFYGIFRGDCSGDVSTCTNEVFADPKAKSVSSGTEQDTKTYVLDSSLPGLASYQQVYTLKACMHHEAWGERSVGFLATAPSSGERSISLVFPGQTMPKDICRGVPFHMMFSNGNVMDEGIGYVRLIESGWDLLSEYRVDIKFVFGFRMAGKS